MRLFRCRMRIPHLWDFPSSIADNRTCKVSSASSSFASSTLKWKTGAEVEEFHGLFLERLFFCLYIDSAQLPTIFTVSSVLSIWTTLSRVISVSITQSGSGGTPTNSGEPKPRRQEHDATKTSLLLIVINLPACLSGLHITNISSFSLELSAWRSNDTPIASSQEYGDKGSSLAKGLDNRVRKWQDWCGRLLFLILCAVFPVASRMLATGLAIRPAVPNAIPVWW